MKIPMFIKFYFWLLAITFLHYILQNLTGKVIDPLFIPITSFVMLWCYETDKSNNKGV